MTAHSWHATVCIMLCAIVLFSCAVHALPIALAAFVFALWHAGMVLWSLRPRQSRAWCIVVNGPRSRLQVSWMAI